MNEITSDFDKLSQITIGTPKENITDYDVTLSPRKQSNYSLPSHTEKVSECFPNAGCERLPRAPYDDKSYDKSFLSKNHHAALSMMGKGRGKVTAPNREIIDQCELDLQREKLMRLTNPLGYSNELIEFHDAATHHQKDNQPQALPVPAENFIPISSNNVALASLSKNAKKPRKKFSNTNGFELNEENFPKLK